jgi:DNA-binding response OmpR family regulator
MVSGFDSNIINITSTLKSLQLDWNMSVASSGKECLKIIRNVDCPDVIIISTKLIDMSGFELTEYIRDDSDIPIMFVSDDNGIKNLVRAFDAGVDDYIVSPINKVVFMAHQKALPRRHLWNNQANGDGLKTGVNGGLYIKSEKLDLYSLRY